MINSVCSWQKTLTHPLLLPPLCCCSYVSPPDRDLSELLKPASVPVSDRVRKCPFDWWRFRYSVTAKNLTLSASRMIGGSGSQSQHIITASIWLLTVSWYIFTLTASWIRSAGMLYELTQCARAAWFSVNKQRRTEIIFYEICQLLLVLLTKFWSLMCFFLKKCREFLPFMYLSDFCNLSNMNIVLRTPALLRF